MRETILGSVHMERLLIDWFYLFNDGHVLQLRSETVAVRRRMNMLLYDYDGQMIPGDECGLKFLTFVVQLRKNPRKASTRKMIQLGIEPGLDAWQATTLP